MLDPTFVETNDVAKVIIKPLKPFYKLPFEKKIKYKGFSKFIGLNHNRIILFGKVVCDKVEIIHSVIDHWYQ